MKRVKLYVLITVLLLFLAIALTLFVWFTIQTELRKNQTAELIRSEETQSGSVVEIKTAPSTISVEPKTISAPIEVIATESVEIALRTLSLSESQVTLLDTFGIDVETFVITPVMIICAEEKLGVESVDNILSGGVPSLTEALTLTGCITN